MKDADISGNLEAIRNLLYVPAARVLTGINQGKKEVNLSEMKAEDLTLVAQLIESMDLASRELEKALEKKDTERFKKVKSEILKFQKQISELIK